MPPDDVRTILLELARVRDHLGDKIDAARANAAVELAEHAKEDHAFHASVEAFKRKVYWAAGALVTSGALGFAGKLIAGAMQP